MRTITERLRSCRHGALAAGLGVFAALTLTAALAAAGDLDSAFGTGGKVLTPVGTGAEGYTLALQPDGKVLLGGAAGNGANFDLALARYNTDGSLDSSFGAGGKVTTAIGNSSEYGYGVAVQPDGKILLGGPTFTGASWDFALVRYNADGSLDGSFGTGGKVVTGVGDANDFATCVALQGDGKILLGGYASNGPDFDFALVRFNADGALDDGFGTGGKVTTAIGSSHDWGRSVVVQPDGKILLGGFSAFAGNHFALVRYNADGSLDTSFGSLGKVHTALGTSAEAYGAALQADGKVLLGGYAGNGSDWDFALARYNSNGALDSSFGTGGKVQTPLGASDDYGVSVGVQADGKILLGGMSSNGTDTDFALARYTSTGSLDTAFGSGGKVTTDFGGQDDTGARMAVQADGKVVLGGFAHITVNEFGSNNEFALARYSAAPTDTIPPALTNQGVGTAGASNGLPYMIVKATDAGSGVLKVQLTAHSTNCHLEYPLGTRVVSAGAPRPHTLLLPSAVSSLTVYVVKDANATARVEVQAWDAANNTALMDPVVANLEIKQGYRLSRTFTGIPTAEHYVTLQNGSPGLAAATLWVDGKVVSRGNLTDGQSVALDVAGQMRSGKQHSVRIVASGSRGATAVLLIGDASPALGAVPAAASGVGGGRTLNLEFSP